MRRERGGGGPAAQQLTPAAGQLTVRAKRLTASRGLVTEELAGSTRSKICGSSSNSSSSSRVHSHQPALSPQQQQP